MAPSEAAARRCSRSIRSPAACGETVPGTGSRTSAASCRTRSRRPTSSPTLRTRVTTTSSSTSSATCCSRSTSSRCCSRSAARATSPRSPRRLTEKLVRRHPHVFGDAGAALAELPTQARTPAEVRENWDAIKQRRRAGATARADVPEILPALTYARKLQRSAAGGSDARRPGAGWTSRDRLAEPSEAIGERGALGAGAEERMDPSALYAAIGELLFARVELSRSLEVDPELALRLAATALRQPPRSARERRSSESHAPPDPRLARQSRPSRSTSARSRARTGAPRCRRAPRPASSRRSSCATAASAWGGKGVAKAVANVNGEIAERGDRARRRSTRARSTDAADRSRRHAEQGAARRQRHPRRLAGGRARRRRPRPAMPLYRYLGGEAAHVLPVPMMNVLNGGAHADNRRRLPGVHGRAGRRATLRRGAAHGRRGLPRAEGGAEASAGSATAVGDEGGFAPDLGSNEEALELLVAGIEPAGYEPGSDVAIALDPATSELYEDGAYTLEHEGRTLDAAEMVGLLASAVRALSDRLDRGRHGRGRLGRLEAADRARSATACQLVGDDLFVTNTERLRARHRARASPTRSSIKVNQIGTLTETLEAIAHGARGRLCGGDVAPLRRDRGHRRSPTSPSRPAAARSRPARRRAPTASPSTTSCCGSRRSWATPPSIRAGRRSRAAALS